MFFLLSQNFIYTQSENQIIFIFLYEISKSVFYFYLTNIFLWKLQDSYFLHLSGNCFVRQKFLSKKKHYCLSSKMVVPLRKIIDYSEVHCYQRVRCSWM
jgi:hypothetical protein